MDIWRKILLATVLVSLAMAPLAIGDYAYTPVTFVVQSSMSFTVTGIGWGPVSSSGSAPGTGTTRIYFNSSISTTPQVIGPCTDRDNATNCQTNSNPMLNFTNTGTATFNMTIRVNESLSVGGGTISLYYNSSCNGGTCNSTVLNSNLALDTSNWKKVCTQLPTTAGNWCGVWLWANFSGVAAGSYTNDLLHNSTLTQGTP